jgi:hypothetical protein
MTHQAAACAGWYWRLGHPFTGCCHARALCAAPPTPPQVCVQQPRMPAQLERPTAGVCGGSKARITFRTMRRHGCDRWCLGTPHNRAWCRRPRHGSARMCSAHPGGMDCRHTVWHWPGSACATLARACRSAREAVWLRWCGRACIALCVCVYRAWRHVVCAGVCTRVRCKLWCVHVRSRCRYLHAGRVFVHHWRCIMLPSTPRVAGCPASGRGPAPVCCIIPWCALCVRRGKGGWCMQGSPRAMQTSVGAKGRRRAVTLMCRCQPEARTHTAVHGQLMVAHPTVQPRCSPLGGAVEPGGSHALSHMLVGLRSWTRRGGTVATQQPNLASKSHQSTHTCHVRARKCAGTTHTHMLSHHPAHCCLRHGTLAMSHCEPPSASGRHSLRFPTARALPADRKACASQASLHGATELCGATTSRVTATAQQQGWRWRCHVHRQVYSRSV